MAKRHTIPGTGRELERARGERPARSVAREVGLDESTLRDWEANDMPDRARATAALLDLYDLEWHGDRLVRKRRAKEEIPVPDGCVVLLAQIFKDLPDDIKDTARDMIQGWARRHRPRTRTPPLAVLQWRRIEIEEA